MTPIDPIFIRESFAGAIPAAQARLCVDAQLKAGRRQAVKRVVRTLKALGLIDKELTNPSIGLITDCQGEKYIIITPATKPLLIEE